LWRSAITEAGEHLTKRRNASALTGAIGSSSPAARRALAQVAARALWMPHRRGRTQGTFSAAKLAAGLPTARAYDLRHSFVSLLIHEGQSILDVARQTGHSPQTCLRDYGHLFDEFDPAKRNRRRQ
jgi:integrase